MQEQTSMHERFTRRGAQLRTLRDEVRVKLHLAGMDARDRWRELEPEVDAALAKIEDATGRALDRLIRKIEKFNDSLNA
jgi:hypothetical protein